jgi:hypothetical protein
MMPLYFVGFERMCFAMVIRPNQAPLDSPRGIGSLGAICSLRSVSVLSAARSGAETGGTKLYVTTFPCHNCARHIVCAGVAEVQYIEPYLKSQAIPLHGDAIVTDQKAWILPEHGKVLSQTGKTPNVLFRPFIGVAPRLYRRDHAPNGRLSCLSPLPALARRRLRGRTDIGN